MHHVLLIVCLQVCLDPAISIDCGDRAPPIYLCVDCVDMLPREQRKHMVDVLKPLQSVPIKCENKVLAAFKLVYF